MSTIDPTAQVHPSADLEDAVAIGPRTVIWHRAQVRAGARVGAECVLGRDVFVDTDVVIGDRVKIQNGALVYHGVTVGNGVFLGPGVILTNDRYPRAITATGELARAEDWTVTPTTIDTGASIGAGAVVVAGCDVGAFATVGAGAVVTRAVPSHALVAGNPARLIGWVCACGARLQTADGDPAPPAHERYAAAPELHCPRCARSYAVAGDHLVPAA